MVLCSSQSGRQSGQPRLILHQARVVAGGTPMPDSLLQTLELRDTLTAEEREVILNAPSREMDFKAGQDIVKEDARPTESSLIVSGLAARSKVLTGGGRQFTALHVPGDFVDLHSLLLKKMDHTVLALAPTRVARVPHSTLRQITVDFPHLARLLWLTTLVDGAIHREWILSMGRRQATARLAHLVCELFMRLKAVDKVDGLSFSLPLTQTQMGDVLGVSSVHMNRILQELRRDGLITWQGQILTIKDWERLQSFAEFDPAYLSLRKEPR
jgi:CRP-like cAMP-binding protein